MAREYSPEELKPISPEEKHKAYLYKMFVVDGEAVYSSILAKQRRLEKICCQAEKLEDCLKKLFVDLELDSFILDSLNLKPTFLQESLRYGVGKKWLFPKTIHIDDGGDGQYSKTKYWLTEKGKNYFGIKIKKKLVIKRESK